MKRIEPRPYRTGTGFNTEPEYIEELEARIAKHDRLTRGKPEKTFAQVLRKKMHGEEPAAEPQPDSKGAKDPLLGLDPNQDASLVNHSDHRSALVIVKG